MNEFEWPLICSFLIQQDMGINEVVKYCRIFAKEIATLIKYSPKFESILWEVKDNVESEDQEDLNDSRKGGLFSLCPTRWTVRGSC